MWKSPIKSHKLWIFHAFLMWESCRISREKKVGEYSTILPVEFHREIYMFSTRFPHIKVELQARLAVKFATQVKLQVGLAVKLSTTVKFAMQVKFCPTVKVKFHLWRSEEEMPRYARREALALQV